MKKLAILITFTIFIVLSSNVWSKPDAKDCVFVNTYTKIIEFKTIDLHIIDKECTSDIGDRGFHERQRQEAYFVIKDSNKIIEIGNDGSRLNHHYIELTITPKDSPYISINTIDYSVSRVWNQVHIFKDDNKKVKIINKIKDPFTNEKNEIIGFYKDKNNKFYIDYFSESFLSRIFNDCNACKRYKIKTLKITP